MPEVVGQLVAWAEAEVIKAPEAPPAPVEDEPEPEEET